MIKVTPTALNTEILLQKTEVNMLLLYVVFRFFLNSHFTDKMHIDNKTNRVNN